MYLNQFVVTRKDKVENIANTESYGIGIRVIATGSWGFAATDKMDKDSITKKSSPNDRACPIGPSKRLWRGKLEGSY